MRLLADENVDRPIVERLRRDGHDVIYVAELDPGITDRDVLRRAEAAGAVLLTEDKDFGEMVFREHLISRGVVLIRLAGVSVSGKAMLVSAAVGKHADDLSGNFSVVTPGAVRIRRR